MDLSPLLNLLPSLSGPYAVPITVAVMILVPLLAKKFPGLSSLLSSILSKPQSPLAPTPSPQPSPNSPQFPLLDSLLSLIKKDGKPQSPLDLAPSILAQLRDEVANLIRRKAETHAAELADLQGLDPEPAKPVVPFLSAAGKS